MNNAEARTLPVRLDFLEPEQRYTAHVYRDDPQMATRTRVRGPRKCTLLRVAKECNVNRRSVVFRSVLVQLFDQDVGEFDRVAVVL
jgi:hypothetical protein